MSNSNKPPFLRVGTPQCGAFIALLGAVLALMLLFLGLWRTLFVVALAAIGYFLGASADKSGAIKGFINRLFPPRNEQ